MWRCPYFEEFKNVLHHNVLPWLLAPVDGTGLVVQSVGQRGTCQTYGEIDHVALLGWN